MHQNTPNYNSNTHIIIILAFLPVRDFSVTIWALVEGEGHTQDLIYPIHNVSLGNWGGLGKYGKHQIRYKQKKSQKPVFVLSGKNSVTSVVFVGGIALHLKTYHIDQNVSFGNRCLWFRVRKGQSQKSENHRALMFNRETTQWVEPWGEKGEKESRFFWVGVNVKVNFLLNFHLFPFSCDIF